MRLRYLQENSIRFVIQQISNFLLSKNNNVYYRGQLEFYNSATKQTANIDGAVLIKPNKKLLFIPNQQPQQQALL